MTTNPRPHGESDRRARTLRDNDYWDQHDHRFPNVWNPEAGEAEVLRPHCFYDGPVPEVRAMLDLSLGHDLQLLIRVEGDFLVADVFDGSGNHLWRLARGQSEAAMQAALPSMIDTAKRYCPSFW